MNYQALAVAVEQIVGGGARQSLAHRPDMRLNNATAERIVERLDLELHLGRGRRIGFHAGSLIVDADLVEAPSRRCGGRAARPPTFW